MEPFFILLALVLLVYILVFPGLANARATKAMQLLNQQSSELAELRKALQKVREQLNRSDGASTPAASQSETAPSRSLTTPSDVASLPTVHTPPTEQPSVEPAPTPSASTPKPTATPPPLPSIAAAPAKLTGPDATPSRPPATHAPSPVPTGSLTSASLEQFLGVKLFAWIGGLALFLGILFFVKYAFERNLISPAMRTTIGYLIGSGLVATGVVLQPRKNYTVLCQTLTATGVLILYGVSYAAHALYHFPIFGALTTLGLMTLITVGAFLLAARMNAQVVAVLGMLGGFLTPMLVHTGEDNPFGLFSYVALLDLGLLALAARRGWWYLSSCAAAGTVLMELAWFASFFSKGGYDEGSSLWIPLGVHLFFPALFLIGAGWMQSRAEARSWHPLGATLGVAAWSAFFAFMLLDYPRVAMRPVPLYSFVFALNAIVLMVVWRHPRARLTQWAAALLTFLHLTIWSSGALVPALLTPALVSYLIAGVMHCGFSALALRGQPELAPAARAAGGWLAPVMMGLVLIPLARFHETSFALWPVVLLLDLAAIALAAMTRSLLPVLVALALTLIATAVWLFRTPPGHENLWGFLVVVGGFAMLFALTSVWLASRISRSPTDETSSELTPEALLPIASGVLPFVLLIIASQRLALQNPSPLFGLGLLLAVFLLALSRRARTRSAGAAALSAVALLCMASLQHAWAAPFFRAAQPWVPLLWAIGTGSLFCAHPFLFQRQLKEEKLPWIVSAASWLVHFPLLYRYIDKGFPNNVMGLVPLALVIPPLAGLVCRLRSHPAENRDARNTQLAWFGGVALFFITLVFPIQLERQWITLGWAFEGAALCWLFTRVPHEGLRRTGFGLLVAAFARLALNPLVLQYQQHSDTPIWNWYLYAYGLTTLAMFAGAMFLAPPRDRMDGVPVRGILWALGGILLFLLVNIEIADAFTPEGSRHIAIRIGGDFARSMTYSISWALFALALLVIGIWRNVCAARYAGVGLLGLTSLKVFFIDLTMVGSIYRIGALIAVALIALIASFLYQRFFSKAGRGGERQSNGQPENG